MPGATVAASAATAPWSPAKLKTENLKLVDQWTSQPITPRSKHGKWDFRLNIWCPTFQKQVASYRFGGEPVDLTSPIGCDTKRNLAKKNRQTSQTSQTWCCTDTHDRGSWKFLYIFWWEMKQAANLWTDFLMDFLWCLVLGWCRGPHVMAAQIAQVDRWSFFLFEPLFLMICLVKELSSGTTFFLVSLKKGKVNERTQIGAMIFQQTWQCFQNIPILVVGRMNIPVSVVQCLRFFTSWGD